MTKHTKELLIYVGVGLLAAVGSAWLRGLFVSSDTKTALRLLCDGAFLSGALLLALSGLTWTRNGGVFDGLGYSMKSFLSLKWPFFGDWKEKFAEYRTRREAKNASPIPSLIVGGCYLAAATVLLIVYSI
jgi:hypothetical protein